MRPLGVPLRRPGREGVVVIMGATGAGRRGSPWTRRCGSPARSSTPTSSSSTAASTSPPTSSPSPPPRRPHHLLGSSSADLSPAAYRPSPPPPSPPPPPAAASPSSPAAPPPSSTPSSPPASTPAPTPSPPPAPRLGLGLGSGTGAASSGSTWSRSCSGAPGPEGGRDGRGRDGRGARRAVPECAEIGGGASLREVPRPAGKAIGVKEFGKYFAKECAYADAVEAVKAANRRLAAAQAEKIRRIATEWGGRCGGSTPPRGEGAARRQCRCGSVGDARPAARDGGRRGVLDQRRGRGRGRASRALRFLRRHSGKLRSPNDLLRVRSISTLLYGKSERPDIAFGGGE
uniref:Uncharacterized protein n=1 Tax=Ananas comosus var. bracteatus TaxID=296719 RepID=A0A6V7QV34_ANACO